MRYRKDLTQGSTDAKVRTAERIHLQRGKKMSKLLKSALVVLALVALVGGAVGCSGQPLSTREKSTGVGAVLGAGTGAIIGAAVGSPGAGAAIGGALGGVGGFAVGNQMQNQETQQQQTQQQIQQQQQQLEQQRRQLEQLKQQQQTE